MLGKAGALEPYTKEDLARMTREVIEPMASDGLRTIGLSYKDFVPAGKKEKDNEVCILF